MTCLVIIPGFPTAQGWDVFREIDTRFLHAQFDGLVERRNRCWNDPTTIVWLFWKRYVGPSWCDYCFFHPTKLDATIFFKNFSFQNFLFSKLYVIYMMMGFCLLISLMGFFLVPLTRFECSLENWIQKSWIKTIINVFNLNWMVTKKVKSWSCETNIVIYMCYSLQSMSVQICIKLLIWYVVVFFFVV